MTDFNFTIHHLRFTVEASTPIEMGEYKGSALRGAWAGYMRQAYCGAPAGARTDAMHQAMCPVCYLTSRETGSEGRRPYALQPPLSRQLRYEPGDQFTFGFTLFGNAHTLFPYVLLAVREVGESYGIGSWIKEIEGRGRYRLVEVSAYDPYRDREQTLFREPEVMVTTPTLAVTAESIHARAQDLMERVRVHDRALQINFLTPLRVIHHGGLMRWFTFSFFFQRLLERLYALGEHFDAEHIGAPDRFGKPALRETVNHLLPLAERVQVVEDQSEWWDVKGYSSRLKKPHYLGGLVGSVKLVSEDWPALLPYLLWGQSVQLGKNVVKGGGWFEVEDMEYGVRSMD